RSTRPPCPVSHTETRTAHGTWRPPGAPGSPRRYTPGLSGRFPAYRYSLMRADLPSQCVSLLPRSVTAKTVNHVQRKARRGEWKVVLTSVGRRTSRHARSVPPAGRRRPRRARPITWGDLARSTWAGLVGSPTPHHRAG